ncbi:MAG TPA: DUF4294 domain-containing protein [Chitinophagaceae bacterium]|nr:DUF4294 domain-containing protein [Chitinophagaceae bacterium]
MMKKGWLVLFINCILVITFCFSKSGNAQLVNEQVQPLSYDTILVSMTVVDGDTMPIRYLNMVNVREYLDPQREAELRQLRYNVMKVYPYALMAADVLQRVDDRLSVMSKKRDKKQYIKETQKALSDQFKDELKSLTMTQGKILVKLINRETGRDTYDVIKQLKGGLNARMYQTTAFFFSNNLKAAYDPFGEDEDIEMILEDIEPYFKKQRRKIELPKK